MTHPKRSRNRGNCAFVFRGCFPRGCTGTNHVLDRPAIGRQNEGQKLPRFPEIGSDVSFIGENNPRFLELPLHEALVESDELGQKTHKKRHLSEV